MLRFGPVSIDPDSRELRLNGEIQHLEPQAFDVLAYLIEHRRRLVPKTELLDQIWGDQFVSESALTTRIKEIRQAVGDSGKAQRVIRNTRGRGYRFVAELDETGTPADRPTGRPERRPRLPVTPVLLGRDDETEQLLRHLEPSTILTLTGPGGVGKTTLAVHLAASVAPSRSDGAFFVDLAAISGADHVLPALRQAAGFASPDTSDDQTIEALSGLDAVMVLDNCEHLVAAAADLVQQIAAFRGPLSILATSRERLGVPGERLYPVEPLDTDSARALFLERAGASRPDLALDPDDQSLDQLLTALDRLPLAIEMAAGRLSAMSFGDLSRLLADELGTLRSPHRHTAERQRTLTGLVEWSVQLLPAAERHLLDELSVFAGAATLDDIIGVLGQTGTERFEIIDRLTALVDRSLVSADVTSEPARYRMLETVKAYTGNQGADLPRRRHAQWYAEAADDADRHLRTAEERRGHDWFERAKPELRAAFLWARDHDLETVGRLVAATALFAHSRLWAEPARWASDSFGSTGDDGIDDRLAAVVAASAAHRSDYGTARGLIDRAVTGPDLRLRFIALDTLGDLRLYNGDLDGAESHYRSLQDLGTDHGDMPAVVHGLIGRMLACTYRRQPTAAITLLDEAPDRRELAPTDQAWLEYAAAEAMVETAPDDAIVRYEHAIDLAESVGNRFVTSVSRVSLAAALARHGRPEDAIRQFRSTLAAFRQDGNLTHAATTLRNLVVFLVRVGADEAAMVLLGALSGNEIKATYGREEERLLSCRADVERRVGVDAVDRWIRAGGGHRMSWALTHSIDVLDSLVATVGAETGTGADSDA